MTNVQAPMPHGASEITPEWITAALKSPAPVTSLALEPVGQARGFVGTIFRCTLRYGSRGVEPSSVVVKMPASDARRRALFTRFGLYEREVSFYRELQAETPIPTPRCYYSAIDEATGGFVLLLEDMGAATSGNPLRGASSDQCRQALELARRLHTSWWDAPALSHFEWMVSPNAPRMKAVIEAEYDAAWNAFELQFGQHLPTPLLKVGRSLGPRLPQVLDHLSAPPVTLVHGDFQPANIFYAPDGSIAAVGDWQVAVRARGAMDVAYFMVNGVDPQDRRAIERNILRDYHVGLLAAGVKGYQLSELWADYRLAVLSQFGLVIVLSYVLGGNTQGNQDSEAAAIAGVAGARLISAMSDLRPWEVLGSGPLWKRVAVFARRTAAARLTGR